MAKDGGEKNSEGCSDVVLYVQLSSYREEKLSRKNFYIVMYKAARIFTFYIFTTILFSII